MLPSATRRPLAERLTASGIPLGLALVAIALACQAACGDPPPRPKAVDLAAREEAAADVATADAPTTDTPAPKPKIPLGVAVKNRTNPAGLHVTWVAPGFPGEDAGFQVGDTIVNVGTKRVRNIDEWKAHGAFVTPGEETRITVRRWINGRDGTVRHRSRVIVVKPEAFEGMTPEEIEGRREQMLNRLLDARDNAGRQP
jgi:hypothetical protein